MNDNDTLKEKVLKLLYMVGDTIKSKRKSEKITIFDLAEKAGISPSVISDLENHKGIMPNIYTLLAIANALGLSEQTFLKYIWEGANDPDAMCNLTAEEKLMTALIEYGLPANCLESVINYVDYFVSLNQRSKFLDNCSQKIFSVCKKLEKNKKP